ncbi:2-oxo-4-hydroxy-4-carboxy-5-ureidoimidazoline decarboxylase [Cohnella sp. GbtcB17]|uniref:2-oxo-4-hydroxy-4-carboxy-5-ureidoimidazoline decarboxylase n=1 Tax=Cohnella sp. GbtcB17 TaxID=2824762 RepID=UPI001C31143F|nr:2-oxo-4-hydroxy-4-carboxy-5-ureidoimidazoline decarboxylase [Cohnella sp. GbtcB17]
MKTTIGEVNKMDRDRFMQVFGDVFEHSPWVAERAWAKRPFGSKDALFEAMKSQVVHSSDEERLALFRAHPDLATRLKITERSEGEQRGAGLDRLSPEEYRRFDGLNRAYRDRFGFPFIMAVSGKTKEQIAQAMTLRIENGQAEEEAQALLEVLRIAEIRLSHMGLDS